MLNPNNDLAIKSTNEIGGSRYQQSDRIIAELNTRQSPTIPLFNEATAQVTRLTGLPISILSLVGERGCQIGSIDGLELFDRVPTDANLILALAGIEYCHHQSIICDRSFAISNFQEHPELNTTALVGVHGIQAYMGVPIITAAGDRLGVISILNFTPHQFSDRDVDLLQLVSRWLASEFERKFLSQAQLNHRMKDLHDSALTLDNQNHRGFDDLMAVTEHIKIIEKDRVELVRVSKKISNKREIPLTYPQIKAEIQFKLMTHLAQKLRSPLTSVLGMASVLQQEIYGSLSIKQKDYLGIIHSSGQQLVSIVDEIAQLVAFDAEVSALADRKQHQINLKSVDLEMLCQLAVQNLEPLLQQKQQQLVLDLSKGNRLWLLDKDNLRQIIYYLSLSLIQGSGTRHQISIQLANLTDRLQLQITTTDPHPALLDRFTTSKRKSASTTSKSMDDEVGQDVRVSLGLSLSYTLASLHGGNIELMPDRRGYILSLPTTSKAAA
jgi:signal transduction histidine kinase